MKSRISVLAIIVTLAILGAFLAGCEDTDLTASSDWVLTVFAVPSQPVIDVETLRARTAIVAKVIDANGVPVESVSVTFSALSGSFVDNVCGPAGCSVGGDPCTTDLHCLLPPTVPVSKKTDADGLAETGFAMGPLDGESVTVTATSGALSGSVNVSNQLGVVNELPVAEWVGRPASPAIDGLPVTLDGTDSFDPDGDVLTCFQWEIRSSRPIIGPEIPCEPPDTNCEMIQGSDLVGLSSPKYSQEQALNVTLRVSDDPDASICPRGGPVLPPSLFGSPKFEPYIICNNTMPIPDAGPSGAGSDYGRITLVPDDPTDPFTGYKVTQILDGSDTSDNETPDAELNFEWSCGNGQARTGVGVVMPECIYTAPGNFVIRLRVSDPGGGNPPQSECALTSGFNESTIEVVLP